MEKKLKRKVPKKLEKHEELREMIEALPASRPAENPKRTETNPNGAGRHPVMTDLNIQKLETAFSFGCSDKEACIYAGLSPATLYDYQINHPEFAERKGLLKTLPEISARQAAVGSFKSRPDIAMRWLEAKLPVEFNTKINHYHTGEIKINYGEEARKRAEKYAEPQITERKDDGGPDVSGVVDRFGSSGD